MNHFISFLLSIGVILILWTSVPADINVLLDFENYEQSYAPNLNMSLQPVLISQPIVIDGVIDSCWFDAACFKNFTEYQPTENKRARVITAGYLAYDADNLYVSFICQDPEISQLRASLTDRDNIFSDDWVCISIDPDNDQQKAYEFYVNARGIQGDRLWQSNGTEDESFDLVWQSDAKIYENYWTAEVRIPFESLRFPNREDQSWLVHFTRQYPRDNQYRFSWMPISADNNSFMGQAGKVDFSLPKVRSDKRTLEVLPYILGNQEGFRVQRPSDGEIGEWKYDETDTRAGFGLKYSISSNLIADFTYNPDFSQIESDAGQISVNFPFALFYDERRPFFQEGADMYVVDQNSTAGAAIDQYINLFYSRSINDPKFAGKISGRNNRLSFGVTSAYDRYTPFVIPFEERSAVLATDKKSYSNIVRMRYDLGNQSSLGMIVTDRRLEETGSNSVASLDANIRLSEKYNLALLAAMTHTQEPDDSLLSMGIGEGSFEVNNEVKTAAFDGEEFYGSLFRAKLNRNSLHWISTLALQDFSPGFRADNGFITSNSYRMAEYITGYFFRFDQHPLFTFIRPRVSVWRKYNYDGVVKDTGLRSSVLFNLNQQTVVNMSAFIFNRENLYGKQFGDARGFWIYVQNNTLNTISGNFFVRLGKEINRLGREGDPRNPFEVVPTLSYNFFLTYKPTVKLDNQVGYQFFALHTEGNREKIRGQEIWRNTLSYQFTRKISLRLIGEYNIVEYYDGYLNRLVSQKYLSLEPLFSYKLNPFSVFYLGGHIGGQNNVYLNWMDMRMTSQSFFIKFQYLFRS